MNEQRLYINEKRSALSVTVARGFADRCRGLMGKKRVEKGLLLIPCGSIHTFFMRSPIDVLFLDASGSVLKVIEHVPPWHITLPVLRAQSVLELPPGGARECGIREGDRLSFGE